MQVQAVQLWKLSRRNGLQPVCNNRLLTSGSKRDYITQHVFGTKPTVHLVILISQSVKCVSSLNLAGYDLLVLWPDFTDLHWQFQPVLVANMFCSILYILWIVTVGTLSHPNMETDGESTIAS